MKEDRKRRLSQRPLPAELKLGSQFEPVERLITSSTSPWAVSADAAQVLARLVVAGNRRRILEFGAGVSSQVFAAALREIGGGSLTSVEEHPEWCEEAWAQVQAVPGVDSMLVASRVRLTIDRRGVYFGYSRRDEIIRRGPFDLVFVDAPYGAMGRDGALHACFEALAPGALIVLDDSARDREQGVLRRWLSTYPGLDVMANDPDVARGLSILSYASPGSGRPSFSLAAWTSGALDLLQSTGAIWRYRRRKLEWS